jgi:hypothetical protein
MVSKTIKDMLYPNTQQFWKAKVFLQKHGILKYFAPKQAACINCCFLA